MEQEAEALQLKLQNSVDQMLKKIDEERLRKIQRNTYLKMAECYDSKNVSSKQIENCLATCSRPVEIIQNIIQNEMNGFQNRLQRCSLSCQDEVNDKFRNLDMSNSINSIAASKMMLSCSSSCVDKNLALLKSIQSKIESDIDKAVNN